MPSRSRGSLRLRLARQADRDPAKGFSSFADLRESPVVSIGALTISGAPPVARPARQPGSRCGAAPHRYPRPPTTGTRNWSWNTHPAEKDCNSSVPLHDALITHILDSETEHDVVMPGGLSIYSTEAAAEFLVDPDLRSLARSVPMGRDDRVLRDGARNRRNREHRRSRTAGDVQRRISVG